MKNILKRNSSCNTEGLLVEKLGGDHLELNLMLVQISMSVFQIRVWMETALTCQERIGVYVRKDQSSTSPDTFATVRHSFTPRYDY